MSDVFDKILSGKPVNRAAAVVAGGKGVHWNPHVAITRNHWDAPPPLRAIPLMENCSDLVGTKFGRFTVVGLHAEWNPKKPSAWVVRCVCGAYETRKAKAIRNPENYNDRCTKCQHLVHLKRQQIRDRTGKWPDRVASDDL